MKQEVCNTCPLSQFCHPELKPHGKTKTWFSFFSKRLKSYLDCRHFLLRSEASRLEYAYKESERMNTRSGFVGKYIDNSKRDLIGHMSGSHAINTAGRVFSSQGRRWFETGQILWGHNPRPIYPEETYYNIDTERNVGVDIKSLENIFRQAGLKPFTQHDVTFSTYMFLGYLEVTEAASHSSKDLIQNIDTIREQGATHYYYGENRYPNNQASLRIELYKI